MIFNKEKLERENFWTRILKWRKQLKFDWYLVLRRTINLNESIKYCPNTLNQPSKWLNQQVNWSVPSKISIISTWNLGLFGYISVNILLNHRIKVFQEEIILLAQSIKTLRMSLPHDGATPSAISAPCICPSFGNFRH